MRAQPFPEHLSGWTAEQVRKAKAPLLAAGEPLMLRAAAALAEVVRDVLRDRGAPVEEGPGILVLAGSGDNGGDALFAAAELAQQGARVRVRATGSGVHEEAADAALAAGAQWVEIGGGFDDAVTSSAVILDGIIGIGGSSPPLRGTARTAVARIRELLGLDGPDEDARADRPAIVAVDLPSGVHSDDGSVPDPTVLPADVTVTFGAVKAGLLREPASRYAGEVRLVELGLDRA